MNKEQILKETRRGLNLYTIDELKKIKDEDPIIQKILNDTVANMDNKSDNDIFKNIKAYKYPINFYKDGEMIHSSILKLDANKYDLDNMLYDKIVDYFYSLDDIKGFLTDLRLVDKQLECVKDLGFIIRDEKGKLIKFMSFKDIMKYIELRVYESLKNEIMPKLVKKVLFNIDSK